MGCNEAKGKGIRNSSGLLIPLMAKIVWNPWKKTLIGPEMIITILQVKTYIVAPLEGKSHTTSSTIGVMT